MKISQLFIKYISCVIVFATFNAHADSLRCKDELVLIGDSKGSIFGKCGEPMLKDSFCKPSETVTPCPDGKGGNVTVAPPCETLDEWTYNPGSGQFYTTLQFERGTLKSIKYDARIP